MKAAASRREPDPAARRRVDRVVHGVLLAGVTASSLFLAAGTLAALAGDGRLPSAMVARTALGPALLRFQPGALVTVGLALLIATPILRVVGVMLAFLVGRDFRFALVAMLVLVNLAAGVLFGGGWG